MRRDGATAGLSCCPAPGSHSPTYEASGAGAQQQDAAVEREYAEQQDVEESAAGKENKQYDEIQEVHPVATFHSFVL